MRFPLAWAKTVAEEIRARLAPHCEKIEIAGSIRRGRANVGDIDLVAIPKLAGGGALFAGAVQLTDTDFWQEVKRIAGVFDCQGEKIIRFAWPSYVPWATGGGPKIGVDLYMATAETWATLLLIRTGSKEHNIWLAQKFRAQRMKLCADGSGIEQEGPSDPRTQISKPVTIQVREEARIFQALGLELIAPKNRECNIHGVPVWLKPAGPKEAA
jgi:DNA polymerase/3'-5' exonuclease PolX